MLHEERVAQIVSEVLAQRINPQRPVNVQVAADTDHDGEPVFFVTAVFADSDWPAVQGRAVGMIGVIRRALQEQGEERFPVLTLVTASDYEGSDAEAA